MGGEGSQEMFYPFGHGPDKARIEMSGHILSTEGQGGELESSSSQLNFKPRALSPLCFYLAPSFVSIYITQAPRSVLSILTAIQYQHSILLSFPKLP